MRSKKHNISKDQMLLITLPERHADMEPQIGPIKNPIWTKNKARLIERYLYYFVFITHHGTYIDGFAGPQTEEDSEMWSAKLVLNSEPRWFRNFFFIDLKPQQIALLRELKQSQPQDPKRKISIYQGDCNEVIPELIRKRMFPEEASFCLLDQRSTECSWATVRAIAGYKKSNKIEIFYFLMNAWFDRTVTAIKDRAILDTWFGNSEWKEFSALRPQQRADRMCERFRTELGYKSAKPWPIYGLINGHRRIMYFMIHATDHPEAPKLMARAYERAVEPKETSEQLKLVFG